MEIFERYRLEKESDGYTIILYLNNVITEFSDEIGHLKEEKRSSLYDTVIEHVRNRFPDLKIKTIRVVLGSIILAVIPVTAHIAKAVELNQPTASITYGNYLVVSGDTLWIIGSKTQIPVSEIKAFNNMASDNIYPNQIIKIPSTRATKINTYIVTAGDTLRGISKRFTVTVDVIRRANNLITDTPKVGQSLIIPTAAPSTGKSLP